MRIEKIKQQYNVKTRMVHFPLHPDTPSEGKTLEALFGADAAAIQQKNADMKSRMDAEGLAYGVRTHTYNSRLAQELGTWAESQDGGDAIHDALFKAYFVDTKNVADIDVLLNVVESVGLDMSAASDVLANRSFKDAVDEDWAKSRQYGVTGVPTYVIGQAGVVGAQPYEAIERLITEAGVSKAAQ